MKFDIVLFDADGTLFDFEAAARRALTEMLASIGFAAGEDVYQRYRIINESFWRRYERAEISREELRVGRFRQFLGEMGLSADPARCSEEYLSRLAKGGDLLPGAEELCRALAPHLRLCLATNGISAVQRERLSLSPLRGLISNLFISEEIGFPKPDRRYFDCVLSRLGVEDRSSVVMLGDSLIADIQGAQNAGIAACWFSPGGAENNSGVTPDWTVIRLEDFVPIALTGRRKSPPTREA